MIWKPDWSSFQILQNGLIVEQSGIQFLPGSEILTLESLFMFMCLVVWYSDR